MSNEHSRRPGTVLQRRVTRLVLPLLVLVLLIGSATPAAADYIEESGYRNCGMQQVKITSYSWGNAGHFRDVDDLYITWYNGYFRYRYSSTFRYATTWAAYGDLGLDSNKTYSYCGPMPEMPET